MTLFGLLGIVISIAGFRFARANESRSRLALFVLLLLMHLGAALAYFLYAQSFGSDAKLYYYDEYNLFADGENGLGTIFLVNFVQFLKTSVGGSYLDYFLLFQAAGFWGLLFVLRSFDEIHGELGQPNFNRFYLLLFLPGLHFWTSAIGKDGLVFLGVAMCTWAAFRLQTRYLVFGAGVVVALLVRPHIALIALVALALAVLLGRNTRMLTRIALLAVTVGGIFSVAGLVSDTFAGLNLTNADAMTEFIQTRSNVNEESGGDIDIIGASFPVKLVSLLFRPLFIDATGMLGYAASLENLVLLLIVLTVLIRFRTALQVARGAMFARFAAILFVTLTLLLAMVNYNVGLGLRQKMMVMPCLLSFFVALLAVRKARRQAAVYDLDPAAYAGTARDRAPRSAF
ncbi:MAG: hypothetical protein WBR13_14030 [Allosphingosinicella sp.]